MDRKGKKENCKRFLLKDHAGMQQKMGGIGLEPTTFAMSTQRSNQLS
jgi:hypothetical protein